MKPDIVFVGAGPVGLFTAIGAKLHNQKLKILMLERHSTYTRDHILIINPSSYQSSHPCPVFQGILNQLHGAVPTREIERKFREYAIQLGIVIINERVTDVRSLCQRYHTAHTVVGADGANSLVREQIFNNEKIQESLQYIVEVKYKVGHSTKKLSALNTVEGLGQIHHSVSEHIGKCINGQTSISLFFFVRKETYEKIREKGVPALQFSDFITENKSIQQLANSIFSWLAYRHYLQGDMLIPGSEKIAAIELKNYLSRRCITVESNVRYLLVGDAFLGIPFFRALNAGFIGGIKAAQLIGHSKNNPDESAKFAREMNQLGAAEISRAHQKHYSVMLGRSFSWVTRFFWSLFIQDLMDPKAKIIMRHARVTPVPFYELEMVRALFSGFLFIVAFSTVRDSQDIIEKIPGVTYLSPACKEELTSIILFSLFIIYRCATGLVRSLRKPELIDQAQGQDSVATSQQVAAEPLHHKSLWKQQTHTPRGRPYMANVDCSHTALSSPL